MEETSLQTTEGTAAIDEGIQIGIPLDEKGIKANKSAQAATGGIQIGIPLEEKSLQSNKSAQAATGGEEIGIPLEEIGMTTNNSAQAATRGKWDFKGIGDNIAMFCTNCKSKVFDDSIFCHRCGEKLTKKQGSENETMNQSSFPTVRPADAATGSQNECPMFEASLTRYTGVQAATGKMFKSYIIEEVANTLQKEKKEEFRKHCKEYIEKWKKKDVKFCITGASRTGKSTFINAITRCKKGDEGFAETSVYGNTTRIAKCYIHPQHSKFELWDLPGVGTVRQKRENYVGNMELKKYDYFLFFFDVISEQDISLAREIKNLGKSLCFVRSKLDIDKKNETQDEGNRFADNIRKKALEDLEKEKMGGVDVFVISSTDTKIGHFESLINHMENNLDEGQYTAVIYSLSLISEPVIRKKFEVLHKRIGWISAVSMFFKDDKDITTNSRSDIILTNLKDEVLLYIDTFQLKLPVVEKLKERSAFEMGDILCKSDEQIKTFIKTNLQSKNVKIFEKGCSFPFSPGQMWSFLHESEIMLGDILHHLQIDALHVFKQLETFRE